MSCWPCCREGLESGVVTTESIGSGLVILIADPAVIAPCEECHNNGPFWEALGEYVARNGGGTIAAVGTLEDWTSGTSWWDGSCHEGESPGAPTHQCRPTASFNDNFEDLIALYSGASPSGAVHAVTYTPELKTWLLAGGVLILVANEGISEETGVSQATSVLVALKVRSRFAGPIVGDGCESNSGAGTRLTANSTHYLADGTYGDAYSGGWHSEGITAWGTQWLLRSKSTPPRCIECSNLGSTGRLVGCWEDDPSRAREITVLAEVTATEPVNPDRCRNCEALTGTYVGICTGSMPPGSYVDTDPICGHCQGVAYPPTIGRGVMYITYAGLSRLCFTGGETVGTDEFVIGFMARIFMCDGFSGSLWGISAEARIPVTSADFSCDEIMNKWWDGHATYEGGGTPGSDPYTCGFSVRLMIAG